jgi:dTDP-4-amino-4,6-dideoxygalactose transaminase
VGTFSARGRIGGRVITERWPTWPISDREAEGAVLRVIRSGRWAISGMNVGAESEERRFGNAFAAFIGVRHGIPTSNGSSALVSALEAVGIGYGDEVLVPGLAWVACASAVARVGAIPVFVDIDVQDYAMRADHAESLITDRTAGILPTHLSSSVADVDASMDLSERYGLALVEDCSQAHGASWRGRREGSFGRAAAFSFQSSKLLTAGEGGVVVTDDDSLADAIQQLRVDGRQWKDEPTAENFPDLRPGFGRQGHNFCMTEMQAAILLHGLTLLDDQNEIRRERVRYLEGRLADVCGVDVVRRRDDPRVDRETYWHLPIRIDSAEFGGASAKEVRASLSALVGLFFEPVGVPMHRHPLYRPSAYQRFPPEHVARLAALRAELPGAECLATECFTMPHHGLLASTNQLDALVDELAALQRAMRGSG